MPIVYSIYTNRDSATEIDYGHPIATTENCEYVFELPTVPGTYRFAVRARSSTTGPEEANTQATVTIRFDENGHDVSRLPRAVEQLQVRATTNDSLTVRWRWAGGRNDEIPDEFLVKLACSDLPGGDVREARCSYVPNQVSYSVQVPIDGLFGVYEVVVQARNEFGVSVALTSSTIMLGALAAPYVLDELSYQRSAPQRIG